jgi:hypothetical protein
MQRLYIRTGNLPPKQAAGEADYRTGAAQVMTRSGPAFGDSLSFSDSGIS